jgi:hypothetical protein
MVNCNTGTVFNSECCYCYLAMLGYCIGVLYFTAPCKNGWFSGSFCRNARNLAVDVIVSNVRNRISSISVYFNCLPTRLQKTLFSSLLLISCVDKSQAFKLLCGSPITAFITVVCIWRSSFVSILKCQ